MVHKKPIKNPDQISSVKVTEFICHLCLIPMKSNTSPKSNLRGHGCHSETKAITGG